MKATPVDWILKIKMEMTLPELEKVVKMCETAVEEGSMEGMEDYRKILNVLQRELKRFKKF